jgi:DNA-directed RNA polymerase subunit M/transcription elongation factor TFIIS
MWRFKSCPKCGGDVYIDKDQYGWFEHCLQCGYIGQLKSVVEAKEQQVEKGKEKEPVAASRKRS